MGLDNPRMVWQYDRHANVDWQMMSEKVKVIQNMKLAKIISELVLGQLMSIYLEDDGFFSSSCA